MRLRIEQFSMEMNEVVKRDFATYSVSVKRIKETPSEEFEGVYIDHDIKVVHIPTGRELESNGWVVEGLGDEYDDGFTVFETPLPIGSAEYNMEDPEEDYSEADKGKVFHSQPCLNIYSGGEGCAIYYQYRPDIDKWIQADED